MRIQTYNKKMKEWIDCEHNGWSELIKDGWIFAYQDINGSVVMINKGYINSFRNEEMTKQSRSDTIDSVINIVLCYVENSGDTFNLSKESLIRIRQTISSIIDNEGKEMR